MDDHMMPLTLESLMQTVQEFGARYPRLEIQVGPGQCDAFGRTIDRLLGGVLTQPNTLRLPASFHGIPIVERDIYPPGIGAALEDRDLKLLLFFGDGQLKVVNVDLPSDLPPFLAYAGLARRVMPGRMAT